MKFIKRRLAIFLVALLAMPTMSVSAGQVTTAQPTVPEAADVSVEQEKEDDQKKEEEIREETQQTEIATDSTATLEGEADAEAAPELMEAADEIELTQESGLETAARAANIAEGTYGNITWVIDGDGKLTINGTGNFMYWDQLEGTDIDVLISPWEEKKDAIKSAVINVTGTTETSDMFSGCSNLTSVDMSGFDTSQVMDMTYMFANCSSLIKLDLSGLDTSNLNNMNGMFAGCTNLTELNLSGWNTSKVTFMANMFSDCKNLTNIKMDGWDTSRVFNMQGMFSSCTNLAKLDLENFDTGNVTNMFRMFNQCENLTELNLSTWNTSKVTDMGGMFFGCEKLTELDLSGWDIEQCANFLDAPYGAIFDNCNSLRKILAPKQVKKRARLYVNDSSEHWHDIDGNLITELPQNLSSSMAIYKAIEQDLSQKAVKYVLYEESVKRVISTTGTVEYILKAGALPSGIELKVDGIVAGIPMEVGSFSFAVGVTVDGIPEGEVMWYKLKVLDNADVNVEDMTDSGYDLTQYVPDFQFGTLSGEGNQTMVSKGEYTEFRDLYLDGVKLTMGTDYTGESGSTRLTIRNQTLSQVGGGRHTLAMEFRRTDGSLRRAAQNYEATIVSDSNDNGNGSREESHNVIKVGSSQPVKPMISYTVVAGDCLWSIAEKFYGSGQYWTKIYADNTAVIRNPDKIYVGQVLQIYGIEADPTAIVQGDTYTVQRGDTLWKISEKMYGKGRKWRKIYQANTVSISDPGRIYAGQVLVIPDE